MAPEPSRLSGRLRFTLRLLFLVFALICGLLAWWTQRARAQRQVAQKLSQLSDTSFQYDYQFKNGGGRIEHRTGKYKESRVPEILLRTFGVDFFHSLTVVYTSNPAAIKELTALPSLECLSLQADAIEDSDLVAVPHISGLQSLFVLPGARSAPYSTTRISDDSLAMISQLPHIRTVFLFGNGFTQVGLESLARARQLEEIYLHGCAANVEYQDLDALRSLPRLKRLDVSRRKGRAEELIESWSPP